MAEIQVSMAPPGTACSRCGDTGHPVYPDTLCYECIRKGVLEICNTYTEDVDRILEAVKKRMEFRDTPDQPNRKRLRFQHLSYHSDFMGMWHVVYRWGEGEARHYSLTERKAITLAGFVYRLLNAGIGTMVPLTQGWVYQGPAHGYLPRWL